MLAPDLRHVGHPAVPSDPRFRGPSFQRGLRDGARVVRIGIAEQMQLDRRARSPGSPHRLDGFDNTLGPDHAADHRDLQRRRRRLFAAREFRRIDPGAASWHGVFAAMSEDRPASFGEMRRCYEVETAKARGFLVEQGLVSLPAGKECRVEPTPPFLRPIIAVASYV